MIINNIMEIGTFRFYKKNCNLFVLIQKRITEETCNFHQILILLIAFCRRDLNCLKSIVILNFYFLSYTYF